MNDIATQSVEVSAASASPFPTPMLVALIFSLAGAFFIGLYLLRRFRNKAK